MAGGYGSADDYAAEAVPEEGRTAWHTVFFAAFGIATALFMMQIAAIIATQYGSAAALVGIAYSCIASALLGWGMVRAAVLTGCGSTLLARLVLGHRGAGLCSLLFSVIFIVYFAIEANIMGASLGAFFPDISLKLLLPLLSVAMLPLVWFGMTILARFQLVSLLLYAVLLAVALGISLTGPDQGRDWLNFTPGDAPPPAVAMLAAIGTMNGIVVIVALQSADYARYIRRAELRLGVLFVGVAFPAFCFGFAGLLGLWFSTRYSETNPGLFFVAILGGWGTLLAFATQLRINAANMYSGALALVNSCRQLANLRLSRHLLLLFFCATVCALLELDVIAHLDVVVNVLGMFTACFTFLLIADFYLVRPIGSHQDAAPEPAWRWPAVLSLALATVAGCLLESGVGGPLWAFAASLVAGLIQVVGYLAISALARSAMFAGRSAAGVTAPLE